MQILNPLIEFLVDEECVRYTPKFGSLEQFRERQRKQIEGAVLESAALFREGVELLFQSDKWVGDEIDFEGLEAEVERQRQFLEASDEWPASLPNIGDLLKLDEAFYNKSLQIALEALEGKRTGDAKRCFMALSYINPNMFQFSEGLGYALIDEEDYEGALVAFTTSLAMAPEQEVYRIALLAAHVLLLLHREDAAKGIAEAVIEEIGESGDYREDLSFAKELLK